MCGTRDDEESRVGMKYDREAPAPLSRCARGETGDGDVLEVLLMLLPPFFYSLLLLYDAAALHSALSTFRHEGSSSSGRNFSGAPCVWAIKLDLSNGDTDAKLGLFASLNF